MRLSGALAAWCNGAMYPGRAVRTWLAGWRDLVNHGSVTGYQRLGWLDRKRLDHAALRVLCGSARFRCAALLLVAVQILVLSLAWHWDLVGWRRDLLRALPALFVLPWFMVARKKTIEILLREADR